MRTGKANNCRSWDGRGANDKWDYPLIPGSNIDASEEDDQDEDDDTSNDNLEDIMQEVNSNVDPDDVSTSITQLTKATLIDQGLKEHLNSLHKGTFKKVESAGLPFYQLEHDCHTRQPINTSFVLLLKLNITTRRFLSIKPLQYGFCKKERGII